MQSLCQAEKHFLNNSNCDEALEALCAVVSDQQKQHLLVDQLSEETGDRLWEYIYESLLAKKPNVAQLAFNCLFILCEKELLKGHLHTQFLPSIVALLLQYTAEDSLFISCLQLIKDLLNFFLYQLEILTDAAVDRKDSVTEILDKEWINTYLIPFLFALINFLHKFNTQHESGDGMMGFVCVINARSAAEAMVLLLNYYGDDKKESFVRAILAYCNRPPMDSFIRVFLRTPDFLLQCTLAEFLIQLGHSSDKKLWPPKWLNSMQAEWPELIKLFESSSEINPFVKALLAQRTDTVCQVCCELSVTFNVAGNERPPEKLVEGSLRGNADFNKFSVFFNAESLETEDAPTQSLSDLTEQLQYTMLEIPTWTTSWRWIQKGAMDSIEFSVSPEASYEVSRLWGGLLSIDVPVNEERLNLVITIRPTDQSIIPKLHTCLQTQCVFTDFLDRSSSSVELPKSIVKSLPVRASFASTKDLKCKMQQEKVRNSMEALCVDIPAAPSRRTSIATTHCSTPPRQLNEGLASDKETLSVPPAPKKAFRKPVSSSAELGDEETLPAIANECRPTSSKRVSFNLTNESSMSRTVLKEAPSKLKFPVLCADSNTSVQLPGSLTEPMLPVETLSDETPLPIYIDSPPVHGRRPLSNCLKKVDGELGMSTVMPQARVSLPMSRFLMPLSPTQEAAEDTKYPAPLPRLRRSRSNATKEVTKISGLQVDTNSKCSLENEIEAHSKSSRDNEIDIEKNPEVIEKVAREVPSRMRLANRNNQRKLPRSNKTGSKSINPLATDRNKKSPSNKTKLKTIVEDKDITTADISKGHIDPQFVSGLSIEDVMQPSNIRKRQNLRPRRPLKINLAAECASSLSPKSEQRGLQDRSSEQPRGTTLAARDESSLIAIVSETEEIVSTCARKRINLHQKRHTSKSNVIFHDGGLDESPKAKCSAPIATVNNCSDFRAEEPLPLKIDDQLPQVETPRSLRTSESLYISKDKFGMSPQEVFSDMEFHLSDLDKGLSQVSEKTRKRRQAWAETSREGNPSDLCPLDKPGLLSMSLSSQDLSTSKDSSPATKEEKRVGTLSNSELLTTKPQKKTNQLPRGQRRSIGSIETCCESLDEFSFLTPTSPDRKHCHVPPMTEADFEKISSPSENLIDDLQNMDEDVADTLVRVVRQSIARNAPRTFEAEVERRSKKSREINSIKSDINQCVAHLEDLFQEYEVAQKECLALDQSRVAATLNTILERESRKLERKKSHILAKSNQIQENNLRETKQIVDENLVTFNRLACRWKSDLKELSCADIAKEAQRHDWESLHQRERRRIREELESRIQALRQQQAKMHKTSTVDYGKMNQLKELLMTLL